MPVFIELIVHCDGCGREVRDPRRQVIGGIMYGPHPSEPGWQVPCCGQAIITPCYCPTCVSTRRVLGK